MYAQAAVPHRQRLSKLVFADLRIEDGIDPTCKEEYLTEDEFSEVRAVNLILLLDCTTRHKHCWKSFF